jgi:hypothetical protein
MKSKDQQRLEEAYTSIFQKTVKRILRESYDANSILRIVKSCIIIDQDANERFTFVKEDERSFTLKSKSGVMEQFSKDGLQLDGLTLDADGVIFDLLPRKVKDQRGTVYTIKRIAPDFSFITYNDPQGTPHNFNLGDDFQFDGTTISVVDYDSDAEDRLTIVHD